MDEDELVRRMRVPEEVSVIVFAGLSDEEMDAVLAVADRPVLFLAQYVGEDDR